MYTLFFSNKQPFNKNSDCYYFENKQPISATPAITAAGYEIMEEVLQSGIRKVTK